MYFKNFFCLWSLSLRTIFFIKIYFYHLAWMLLGEFNLLLRHFSFFSLSQVAILFNIIKRYYIMKFQYFHRYFFQEFFFCGVGGSVIQSFRCSRMKIHVWLAEIIILKKLLYNIISNAIKSLKQGNLSSSKWSCM